MKTRLLISSVLLIGLSGCVTSSVENSRASGGLTGHLKGGATGVREFFAPGSEAFERGQRYMADKELFKALDAFAEAVRRAPNNQQYLKAVKTTRDDIISDGMARVGRLPSNALPEKIAALSAIQRFDDGSTISVRKHDLENQLSKVQTDALSVRALAANDPLSALHGFMRLREYEGSISEVADAKTAVVGQRDALLKLIRNDERAGSLEAAEQIVDKLLTVLEGDEEARRLKRELGASMRAREMQRRRDEVQRLATLGQQAEDAGAFAIALEYYKHANSVANPDISPTGIAPTETRLRDERPMRTILFSESIPNEYRRRLTELVGTQLTTQKLPIRLDVLGADRLKHAEFVAEVQLIDLQWNVEPGEPEKTWSRFLSGYQKLPNPAHAQALVNYQRALQDDTVTRATARGWLGAANILLSAAVVGSTRSALNSTPQFIDEPTYQNYSYMKRGVREAGREAVRVSLIDAKNRRRYAAENISVEHDVSHIEITGAHPEDQGGAKNSPFSTTASQQRRDSLRTKALALASDKVVSFLVAAERYRGDDYLEAGAALEGVEAHLRYAALVQESTVGLRADGAKITEESWRSHLERGFPASGKELVETSLKDRTLPNDSVLAARQASMSAIAPIPANTAQRVALTAEELVRRVAPSVATIRTFIGQGSGFIVDQRGLLLTNAHVVSGARDVAVTLADGAQYMATIVFRDESRDVAVLKIEGKGFRELLLRSAADVPSVGESVLAVGAPLGLQNTVTQGIVSGVRRAGDITRDAANPDPDLNLVQTDAAINSGNSGGPLIDKFGLVLGMNSFKRNAGEGLGFAISSGDLRKALDSLPEETK
jgi:tetratricopeptide (TPR) repeat protein